MTTKKSLSKKAHDVELDEIIDNSEIDVASYMEATSNSGYHSECFIEITLNYPRTQTFLNKNSTQQQALYCKLWNRVKNARCVTALQEAGHVYEYCKSGQVHMHGYMRLKYDRPHFVFGVISDIVKSYLNCLPKRYQNYSERHLHYEYKRYRCPSICVQYRDIDDKERIDLWHKYMRKTAEIFFKDKI